MNAASYMMYTDAERTAAALLLEDQRAISYPQSTWERAMRFERTKDTANRVRETVNAEAEKQRIAWAKERGQRKAFTQFWIARYSHILPAAGVATVEQKQLLSWLNQIAKLIPTQKARGEVGKWYCEPQYQTVTLDMIGGKLSASFHVAINGQWGWVTAITRLSCPMSEGAFTVTLGFDTFQSLIRLLDTGAVILRKANDISPLSVEQGRSKTRLVHREIGDQFEWMVTR